MGGILKVADIPSFLDNMDRVYAEADLEALAWSEFCRAWWEEFQDRLVASDLLLGLATQKSLLVDLWGCRNDQGARVRFGKALSKMKDRVIGSFRIRWAGEDGRNKVQTYRLERVFSNASTPQCAGDAGDRGGFSTPQKQNIEKSEYSMVNTVQSLELTQHGNLESQRSPASPATIPGTNSLRRQKNEEAGGTIATRTTGDRPC
jgi:hypothetical protein